MAQGLSPRCKPRVTQNRRRREPRETPPKFDAQTELCNVICILEGPLLRDFEAHRPQFQNMVVRL